MGTLSGRLYALKSRRREPSVHQVLVTCTNQHSIVIAVHVQLPVDRFALAPARALPFPEGPLPRRGEES